MSVAGPQTPRFRYETPWRGLCKETRGIPPHFKIGGHHEAFIQKGFTLIELMSSSPIIGSGPRLHCRPSGLHGPCEWSRQAVIADRTKALVSEAFPADGNCGGSGCCGWHLQLGANAVEHPSVTSAWQLHRSPASSHPTATLRPPDCRRGHECKPFRSRPTFRTSDRVRSRRVDWGWPSTVPLRERV